MIKLNKPQRTLNQVLFELTLTRYFIRRILAKLPKSEMKLISRQKILPQGNTKQTTPRLKYNKNHFHYNFSDQQYKDSPNTNYQPVQNINHSTTLNHRLVKIDHLIRVIMLF